MELISELRKCVRFPWEVAQSPQNSGQFHDSEVMRRLQHESGLSPKFMEAPAEGERRLHLMQSIAVPTLLALIHGKTRALQKRNAWVTMSQKERSFVLSEIGLNADMHKFVFHLVMTQSHVLPMASYIAATYALTTYTVPLLVDYQDVVSSVFGSMSGDAYVSALERVGLLIVMYPMGDYPGAEKASGPLFTLFAKRSDMGRPTVFLDLPSGEVAHRFSKGQMPSADMIVRMVKDSVTGSTRVGYYLHGPNTYYNVNAPARELNVSRTAFFV